MLLSVCRVLTNLHIVSNANRNWPTVLTPSCWFLGSVLTIVQKCWIRQYGSILTITLTLPKDWRRPPGRPHHTWLRTLDADLQPHNLGLNSAWKYTQDREHWIEAPRGNRYAPARGMHMMMMMMSKVCGVLL